jgi:hypothetical protein
MPDEAPEPLEADLAGISAEPGTEADPEKIKAVRDVLMQLTKTAKTIKLYLPNNPIYQKFRKDLFDRFHGFHEQFGEMKLRIRQYEILCEGQVVYQNPASLESLAFKMYVDGLRELVFGEGLEIDEVTDFLEIIGRKYDPDDPDDDIVTLLWERRLPHLRYLISEDFIKETVSEPMESSPEGISEISKRESRLPQPTEVSAVNIIQQTLGIQLLDKTIGSVFTLTGDEIARLKREIEREEATNPVSSLIRILLEVLRIDGTDEGFNETAGLLETAFETLVRRGELVYANQILTVTAEYLKPESDLSNVRRGRLRESLKKAGTPRMIEVLGAVLEENENIDPDDLNTYLMFLEPESVIPLVDLMGQLKRAKMRRSVCEALVVKCNRDIEPLLKGLHDRRWFVVRNILYVLGRIGSPDALARLQSLVSHKEARVRRELIFALDAIHDDRAKDLLITLAEDRDPAIRTLAVRSLAAARFEKALDPLLRIVHQKEFIERETKERKEWFGALGQIGGNEMIPLFQRVLMQGIRSWVKRNIREEMAVCAVEGLRKIGSPEAVEILRLGERTRRKEIREACERAVKELERGAHGG